MKKILSKRALLSLVLILSICFGMLPLMTFTSSAEDSLLGGIDCCESYAAENESLDFDFSASESNAEILRIESTSEEIIASIKSDSPFTIRGTVEKDGKITDANEYFDFSSVSRFDIAAWASRKNYISEAEKIDCYCDLYINRNFENIYCLNSVANEIAQYRDNNLLTAEMSAKIDAVFEVPFADEVKSEETAERGAVPGLIPISKLNTTNFVVTYDSSVITAATARTVANYFESVRSVFINAGYNIPLTSLANGKYSVTLEQAQYASGSTVAGVCRWQSSSTNTASSYIILYEFSNSAVSGANLTTDWKEIIYHEYFHAIQNAYNWYTNWFKEACAEWAVINFLGTSSTINYKVQSFLSDQKPITELSGLNKYGAVLYCLAIERDCGGAATIRKIYEAFNRYENITDSKFRAVITEGIQDAGYNGTFVSVYRRMTAYSCKPGFWYQSVYPNSSVWNGYILQAHNLFVSASTVTTYNESLAALESDYLQLMLPTTFVGTATIDVTFSNGGYMQIYMVTSTTQGMVLCSRTNANYTTEEITECEDYDKIIAIISNTGTSISNYSVTVTLTSD